MPTYTVTEILSRRPWPSTEDTKVNYFDFKVEGDARSINVGRKPGNDLTVGERIEGTVEPGDRGGFKFVKANNFGGGGGGPRPRDPKEAAVIVQQHSQHMALKYAELQHARGGLPENFNLEQLLVIAGKFADDAKAAQP